MVDRGGNSSEMNFVIASPVAMSEGETGGHGFRIEKAQAAITVTHRFPAPRRFHRLRNNVRDLAIKDDTGKRLTETPRGVQPRKDTSSQEGRGKFEDPTVIL